MWRRSIVPSPSKSASSVFGSASENAGAFTIAATRWAAGSKSVYPNEIVGSAVLSSLPNSVTDASFETTDVPVSGAYRS